MEHLSNLRPLAARLRKQASCRPSPLFPMVDSECQPRGQCLLPIVQLHRPQTSSLHAARLTLAQMRSPRDITHPFRHRGSAGLVVRSAIRIPYNQAAIHSRDSSVGQGQTGGALRAPHPLFPMPTPRADRPYRGDRTTSVELRSPGESPQGLRLARNPGLPRVGNPGSASRPSPVVSSLAWH